MISNGPAKEEALKKLKHYCAYQERSHQEVREKLFSLGARKNEREEIIAALIEGNYLNEERFAIAFAGGKWRIKRWGRNKIRYELKKKGLSPYCIKKAMKEIEEDEYRRILKKLIADKKKLFRNLPSFRQRKKIMDYFTGRGYEAALLRQLLT